MNTIKAILTLFCLGLLDTVRSVVGRTAIQANVVPGTVGRSPGCISRTAEVALTAEHLLLKQGTADTELDICGASDYPLGWNDDIAAIDANVVCQLLGSAKETAVLTASGACNAGEPAYTAAGGKASELSAVAGTYYHVGTFLTTAADGEEVEVDPCIPRAEVVS